MMIAKKQVRRIFADPDGTGPAHLQEDEGPIEQGQPIEWKSGTWKFSLTLPNDVAELKGLLYPLEMAAGLASGVRDVEQKLADVVRFARTEGHTWTEIGTALGMSKQAAWERFSGEE